MDVVNYEHTVVKPLYTILTNLSSSVDNKELLGRVIGKALFTSSANYTNRIKPNQHHPRQEEASIISLHLNQITDQLYDQNIREIEKQLVRPHEIKAFLQQPSISYLWDDYKKALNDEKAQKTTTFFTTFGVNVIRALTEHPPINTNPAEINIRFEDKYRNRIFHTLTQELYTIKDLLNQQG